MDNTENIETPEKMDDGIYYLTDEEGNESAFEVIGTCEYKGSEYFAMIPVGNDNGSDKDSDEFTEYVILKSVTENGEEMLVTIDDDDEFDEVADYFDDMLTSEIDYDAGADANADADAGKGKGKGNSGSGKKA